MLQPTSAYGCPSPRLCYGYHSPLLRDGRLQYEPGCWQEREFHAGSMSQRVTAPAPLASGARGDRTGRRRPDCGEWAAPRPLDAPLIIDRCGDGSDSRVVFSLLVLVFIAHTCMGCTRKHIIGTLTPTLYKLTHGSFLTHRLELLLAYSST